jgi:hypothetical protein
MGTHTGMRGKDVRKFLMVARQFNVILLIRHTNEDSLRFVERQGFYPKPAVVKAKTADVNPPPSMELVGGRRVARTYDVAGLVTHPGFQPKSYVGAKVQKAVTCWEQTMAVLSPTMANVKVDLAKPDSWSIWGVDRVGANAPRWSWRVDVNPESPYFGALQLKQSGGEWCYIHGDYDLKDVIVRGHETDNRRNAGTVDGVKNFTPILMEHEFERIRQALNSAMGVEMVQHGAEAQFAWHGDEPITVLFPDFTHLLLYDAGTVQGWYERLNREVLAAKGTDYLRERSRVFHFGPHGMFAPGKVPASTWG